MIINLLGPIVISPYAEKDSLVVMTHDSRTPTRVEVYDGVVYEVFEAQFRHNKVANEFLAREGVLRTELPKKNAAFVVAHMHWPRGNASEPRDTRTVRIIVKDEVLMIRDTAATQEIVIDMGLTIELKLDGTKNVWDHLTEDR